MPPAAAVSSGRVSALSVSRERKSVRLWGVCLPISPAKRPPVFVSTLHGHCCIAA